MGKGKVQRQKLQSYDNLHHDLQKAKKKGKKKWELIHGLPGIVRFYPDGYMELAAKIRSVDEIRSLMVELERLATVALELQVIKKDQAKLRQNSGPGRKAQSENLTEQKSLPLSRVPVLRPELDRVS